MPTQPIKDPIINVGDKYFRRSLCAYTKRFRSLNPEKKTIIAVGVYAEDGRQLVFEKFLDEDEQQQWLDRLNATIFESSGPENLVKLPDGTFVLDRLIKFGDQHPVGRGHAIVLSDKDPTLQSNGKKDMPLITVLVESKEVALHFLESLAKRLNNAN